MLCEVYSIPENYITNLYQPENIRNFNRQIIDDFNKNIEVLEKELLSLNTELQQYLLPEGT
jgi:hypothetical protein